MGQGHCERAHCISDISAPWIEVCIGKVQKSDEHTYEVFVDRVFVTHIVQWMCETNLSFLVYLAHCEGNGRYRQANVCT